MSLIDEIKSLPKAELHAHLNGSVPYWKLTELAQKCPLLTQAEKKKLNHFKDIKLYHSLHNCFSLFPIFHKIIGYDNNLFICTKETIQSFHDDGVTYLELRTTPKIIGPATAPQNYHAYCETIFAASDEIVSKLKNKITVKWILSINRLMTEEEAHAVIDYALLFRYWVVGIDFSGNPEINSFRDFSHVFKRARDVGFKITVHFAETGQCQDSEDILNFHPHRLGHALSLPSSSKLCINLFYEKKIPVEICFTSNNFTSGGFDNHIVEELYFHEYPFVICTDDQAIFNSTLSEEYLKIAQVLKLDINAIKKLAERSFSYKF